MAVVNVRDAVTEASLIIGQRAVACCVGLRARYNISLHTRLRIHIRAHTVVTPLLTDFDAPHLSTQLSYTMPCLFTNLHRRNRLCILLN